MGCSWVSGPKRFVMEVHAFRLTPHIRNLSAQTPVQGERHSCGKADFKRTLQNWDKRATARSEFALFVGPKVMLQFRYLRKHMDTYQLGNQLTTPK